METQPFETWRILDMSQGLAPEWASSTIFCLVESGKGRPETKTPPSWLIPECPGFKVPSFCSKQIPILWNQSITVYLLCSGHPNRAEESALWIRARAKTSKYSWFCGQFNDYNIVLQGDAGGLQQTFIDSVLFCRQLFLQKISYARSFSRIP